MILLRALNWFRAVVPVGWVIVSLLPILLVEALSYSVHENLLDGEARTFQGIRDLTLLLSGVTYGVYRAVVFHPFYRKGYREWLALTPWTLDKPLPLGPIRFAMQDVVLVLLYSLILSFQHGAEFSRIVPINYLLLSYLTPMAFMFLCTGAKYFSYALTFGILLAIRLGIYSLAGIVTLAVFYFIALWGLRVSLAYFPWTNLAGFKWFTKKAEERKPSFNSAGWPHDQLRSNVNDQEISLADTTIWSLLGGWALYVATYGIPHLSREEDLSNFFFLLIVAPCILGRLYVYCKCYWFPISLWGRFWTSRWFLPGYDQVFFAPVFVLFTGILFGSIHIHTVIPPHISLSIGTTIILWLSLNCPPSLRKWKTTGQHRIVPDYLNAGRFTRQ